MQWYVSINLLMVSMSRIVFGMHEDEHKLCKKYNVVNDVGLYEAYNS